MRAGFVQGNWSKCLRRRVATKRKGQIASTCFSLAYPRGLGNTANISSTGSLLATATAVKGQGSNIVGFKDTTDVPGSAAARPHHCTGPIYRSANEVQGRRLLRGSQRTSRNVRCSRSEVGIRDFCGQRSALQAVSSVIHEGVEAPNRACFPQGERTGRTVRRRRAGVSGRLRNAAPP
jgi:hypothetical protein